MLIVRHHVRFAITHIERTKHIDVNYHFLTTKKMIKVNKVDTSDNPADKFTKLVPQRARPEAEQAHMSIQCNAFGTSGNSSTSGASDYSERIQVKVEIC
ncbi:hypothetical protein MTR_7g007100 [Medicago truncatula]|uniref:Uncharacterized protein n=1 Tax=Medicago truncatula TaxID=3880 RepID=A0A072TVJ4_MEDTR|nr:hypothetical protein MTR_7g007100 [Medicago truncatula]